MQDGRAGPAPPGELDLLLAGQPLLARLDPAARARAGQAAVVEDVPAGAVLEVPGGPSGGDCYLVGAGSAEVLEGEEVVDLVGVGELVGLPGSPGAGPGTLRLRVREALRVYRIPVELLTAAASARAAPPVLVAGLHRPALVLPGDTSLEDALARLESSGSPVVLVRHGEGRLGILTDRDLRTRVLTPGLSLRVPLAQVMTPDAVTIGPEASAEQALTVMVEHGVRQLPVLTRTGQVQGVVSDVDLLAAEAHAPLRLARAMAGSRDVAELAGLAGRIGPALVEAVDAGLAARAALVMRSALVEAVVRRLGQLGAQEGDVQPFPGWLLVLGSTGRRESFPCSDVDTALSFDGDEGDPALAAAVTAFGRFVVGGLSRCGLPSDRQGVAAADPRFARSAAAWSRAVAGWVRQPTDVEATIYISALLDARVAFGPPGWTLPGEVLAAVRGQPRMLRALARLAVRMRTGEGSWFERITDQAAGRLDRVDVKRAGLLPVVDLARYWAAAAGVSAVGTTERLRQSGAAGVVPTERAGTLIEVFELLCELRMHAELELVRRGGSPAEGAGPTPMGAWRRAGLRQALREVADAQHALARDLQARRL